MKIKITFLLLFINSLIFGQLAGVYKPLKFEDIEPNWIHVSFDSTIVGHIYEDARSNIEFDGYSHILGSGGIESEPLIRDGYYYKISKTIYDGDVSGGLIEKIDLTTGQLVWKNIFDLRTANNREFIARSIIKDKKLILINILITTPDHPTVATPIVMLSSLYTEGVLKVREYDLETGELLNLTEGDSNHPNIRLIRSASEFSSRINMIDDNTFEIIDYKSEYQLDIAPYILIDTINRFGLKENETDTLFSTLRYTADWTDSRRTTSFNIQKDEYTGAHVWVDDYIAGDITSDTSKAHIVISERGVLRQLDANFLFEEGPIFSTGLLKITNLYYLIIASHRSRPTGHMYYVVDKLTGQLINKYYISGSQINTHITEDGKVYYSRILINSTNDVYNRVLETTSSSTRELTRLRVCDSSYKFLFSEIYPLPEGRFLISGMHTESLESRNRGRFMSDLVVTAEMLGISVNTVKPEPLEHNYTIFPNPTSKMLNIDKGENLEKIEIMDMSGGVLKNIEFSNSPIDVSCLFPGPYILLLYHSDGISPQKFIVR